MFQQNQRLGSALEQKVQVRCCLGFFWLVVFFSFKVECFASLLKMPSAVNQNLWEICPSLEPGLCFLACEPPVWAEAMVKPGLSVMFQQRFHPEAPAERSPAHRWCSQRCRRVARDTVRGHCAASGQEES